MKPLDAFTFSFANCSNELDALDALLSKNEELKEREHILPIFRNHKNIAALIGTYAPTLVATDRLSLEYTLYGDFRADLIVGDWQRKSFCLVECKRQRKYTIEKRLGCELRGSCSSDECERLRANWTNYPHSDRILRLAHVETETWWE